MNGWRDGGGSVGRKLSLVTIEIPSGFILIQTNVIKPHLTLSFSLQLLGKKLLFFLTDGIRFLTETFT